MKLIGTYDEEYPVELLKNGAVFNNYDKDKIFTFLDINNNSIDFYYVGFTFYKFTTRPDICEPPRLYFQWKEKWYIIYILSSKVTINDINKLFSGKIIDIVEGKTLSEKIRDWYNRRDLVARKEDFAGLYKELKIGQDEFWSRLDSIGVRFTREEAEKVITYFHTLQRKEMEEAVSYISQLEGKINIIRRERKPLKRRPTLYDFKEYGFIYNSSTSSFVNDTLGLTVHNKDYNGYTLEKTNLRRSLSEIRANVIIRSREYDVIVKHIELFIKAKNSL